MIEIFIAIMIFWFIMCLWQLIGKNPPGSFTAVDKAKCPICTGESDIITANHSFGANWQCKRCKKVFYLTWKEYQVKYNYKNWRGKMVAPNTFIWPH